MNPRAAINDLHPFQGCPFGHLGTSPSKLIQSTLRFDPLFIFVCLEKSFSLISAAINANGEGGIRTHAPLRTNGFQDRLVMTTSIPLHMFSIKQNTGIFCILSSLLFIGKNVFKLCCCGTLCLFRCLCSSAVQKLL